MALQAWIGRTAGQLDADSPLDITLFNGIDDDLIHLKQVVYGDGAGGFLTAIDGHNHSGADSSLLALISVRQVSLSATIAGTCNVATYDTTGTPKSTTQVAYAATDAGTRFWLNRPGTWRVYASIKQTGGGTVEIQIDLDGGSVGGATTSSASGTYAAVSFDIPNCVVGSFIDIQWKRTGGTSAEITDMRIANHGGSSVVQAGWDETT